MFYCFIGNKGGGKSYGLLQVLVDELRLTDRPIITNLPVDLGKLQAWIDGQNWGKLVDVAMRVHLLGQDDLWEFYRHRPGVLIERTASLVVAGGQRVPVLDFSKRTDNGVLYIIDECHVPFPSERWAAVAEEMNFYNTQERKLLDDTIFATQVPSQMAKPLRGLIQEWTETRNMNKEPILGCRFPGRFRWRMTLKQPDGREQVAINHRYVTMDKSLAGCYNTLAGVGITGRGDPNAERGARGIRWQVGIMIFVLVVVCLGVGMFYGGKYGFKAVQKGVIGALGISVDTGGRVSSPVVQATGVMLPEVKAALSNLTEQNPPARVSPITAPSFGPGDDPKVERNSMIGGRAEPRLYVMGTAQQGNQVRVYLNDGRIITDKDPRLQLVGPHGIIYDGVTILRVPKDYTSRSETLSSGSEAVASPLPPVVDLTPRFSVGREVKVWNRP